MNHHRARAVTLLLLALSVVLLLAREWTFCMGFSGCVVLPKAPLLLSRTSAARQRRRKRRRRVGFFGSSWAVYDSDKDNGTVIARQQSAGEQDDDFFSSMRVSELKAELDLRKVNYADCFDKESLVARLRQQAQQQQSSAPPTTTTTMDVSPEGGGGDQQQEAPSACSFSTGPAAADTAAERNQEKTDGEVCSSNADKRAINNNQASSDTATSINSSAIDEDEILSMSVRELRGELASRRIRWAGLLEKQDLVRAVIEARQAAAAFSVTGLIEPGRVAQLTGEQVERELQRQFTSTTTTVTTPLLLDVYATWCGPCQMMVPILQETAVKLGDTVRVAKMDSDLHNDVAGKLRVQGLPTLILFDEKGREIDRLEGALMTDQLVHWIKSKI